MRKKTSCTCVSCVCKCDMRRIHACHMRRRTHAYHEEEDTCARDGAKEENIMHHQKPVLILIAIHEHSLQPSCKQAVREPSPKDPIPPLKLVPSDQTIPIPIQFRNQLLSSRLPKKKNPHYYPIPQPTPVHPIYTYIYV